MKNSAAYYDRRYYRRYYIDPETRARTPADDRRLAAFIAAYAKHLEIDVRRILDIGCGLGRTLRALARRFPRARLVGIEYSPYLCERYGWQHGSVTDFSATPPFDLVICNDVLPALDDADCGRAIANLATLSRQLVFIGALTREDWARCDASRTERDVHLRSAAWYRRRLRPRFVALGGGLFAKRDAPITHWSLDCLE